MMPSPSPSPAPIADLDLKFMYLMCSRFCHDLAAPLGALSLGLDMLNHAQEEDSPESIFKYSVQSAMYKLELMRCLCGYGSYTDRPTLGEARDVIDKSYDPAKFVITWAFPPEDEIYNKVVGNAVRLYLALFMTSMEALPRGGIIALNKDFSITLTGSLVKVNDVILNALNGDLSFDAIDSKTIVAYFAYLLAQKLDTKICTSFEKTNFVRIYFE